MPAMDDISHAPRIPILSETLSALWNGAGGTGLMEFKYDSHWVKEKFWKLHHVCNAE